MRLDDSCACGSTFSAKGLPVNVGGAYEAWLSVHGRHADRVSSRSGVSTEEGQP